MSENPESNAEGLIEERFISIVESTPGHDIGISGVDIAMGQYRDTLYEKHVRRDASDILDGDNAAESRAMKQASMDVEGAQVSLELLWLHYRSTAHVTGRVYLVDQDEASHFPREWHKPEIDQQGRAYYFLDDESLVSRGIEVTLEKNKEGRPSDVLVRYLFSHVKGNTTEFDAIFDDDDDNDDVPLLYALPGELATHSYETPSPDEAELRMKNHWPNEYRVLKYLSEYNPDIPLLKRIVHMGLNVKDALAASDEFKTILEVHLDERLSLNRRFPYLATIQHEVLCYDGEGSPYESSVVEGEGSWTKVVLDQPLTVVMHGPSVRFFVNSQGEYHAFIVGTVYSEGGGDTPEYVRFDVELGTQFRSTRAQRAILDRVFTVAVKDGSDSGYLKETVGRELDAEHIPAALDADDAPTPKSSEYIQDLELLSREIMRMQDEVTRAQEGMYASVEEAVSASEELGREVWNTLVGAGVTKAYDLTFSGNVSVPSVDISYDPGDDETRTVTIKAKKELDDLDNGDVIQGRIVTWLSGAQQVVNEEGAKQYIVNPAFVAVTQQRSSPLVNVYGADFADMQHTLYAHVPMSRDAEISVDQFEAYKRASASIGAAEHSYGNHPVIDVLRSIKDEFATEQESTRIDFTKMELLHSLESHTSSLLKQGMSTKPMSAALEDVFVGRSIQLDGDMFERKEEGVVSKLRSAGDGYTALIVADVRYENEQRVWRLVCTALSGDVVYVPFRSLKGLKF